MNNVFGASLSANASGISAKKYMKELLTILSFWQCENVDEKNHAKEVAVRSKKLERQSTEHKAQTRRKKSSHISVAEVASDIRNSKTRPHDFPTSARLSLSSDAQSSNSKAKSSKNTLSSIKSTIREEQ
jgi:hypothetical protein